MRTIPALRALTASLVFILCLGYVHIATATNPPPPPIATSGPPCSLRGVTIFLPAAIIYHDRFDPTCPNRGQCLTSTAIPAVVSTFSSDNSIDNPLILNMDTCVPDGRILVTAHANISSSPAVRNPPATISVGNRFIVFPTDQTPPTDQERLVANQNWQSPPNACYTDGLYYANVSSVLGTGATGETEAQRTTNLVVRVYSTAAGSPAGCTQRDYFIRLINRDCENPLLPFIPACAMASISLATSSGTPITTYPQGTLPTRGNPIIAEFPFLVTGNSIRFTATNGRLLNAESTVTMIHYTQQPGGNWVQQGGVITIQLPALQLPVTVDLPWDPTHPNRYEYDISSSYTLNECSVINRILEFSNPTGGFGDPQFVGLSGQSFQIHGYDGAVFSIISNQHFQLNSLFAFLTGPRPCPTMPSGQKSAACWAHDGSYLGELGLMTNLQDQVYVGSGSAADGFDKVTVNHRPLAVGETEELHFMDTATNTTTKINAGKIHRMSTHEISIQISAFIMEIENVDSFVNVRRLTVIPAYSSRAALGTLRTHGLLGQTWQSKRYKGTIKEIEGEVDDYVVEDGLFGNDFIFNRFSIVTSD